MSVQLKEKQKKDLIRCIGDAPLPAAASVGEKGAEARSSRV